MEAWGDTRDIVEVFVVVGVSVLPWSLAGAAYLRRPREVVSLTTLDWAAQFTQSLAVILVLLYVALNQPLGLASIGISPLTIEGVGLVKEIVLVVVGGPVLLSVFLLPVTLPMLFVRRVLKREPRLSPSPSADLFSSCRTGRQRLVCLALLLTAATAEELVFRGYFVLLLGQRTGSVSLCILVSALLFVVGHLHYGRSRIPYYLWFALCLGWFFLAMGNIAWAISAHWGVNVLVALRTWLSRKEDESVAGAESAPGGD